MSNEFLDLLNVMKHFLMRPMMRSLDTSMIAPSGFNILCFGSLTHYFVSEFFQQITRGCVGLIELSNSFVSLTELKAKE